MSFFKSLARIGISRDYLQTISEDDVIRIEKKLTAERKLNDTLSKNDVDKIVHLLRTYPSEIRSICCYEGLYCILSGEKAGHTDSLRFHAEEEEKRIRELVSVHFEEELISFIEQNFKHKNWNSLRILAGFKIFLGLKIEQLLVNRLEGKLTDVMAVLGRPPSFASRRTIGYLKKKEFFLLLNEVDPIHFKSYLYRIFDLTTQYIRHTPAPLFFYAFLRAVLEYAPYDGSLQYKREQVFQKVGVPPLYIMLGVAGAVATPFVLFFLIVGLVQLQGNKPGPRINRVEKAKPGSENRLKYLLEEQNISMLNFVEARMFPVSNPLKTENQEPVVPEKYRNPFELELIRSDSPSIRNHGKQVNIFNNTEFECIVLAYFEALKEDPDIFRRVKDPQLPRIYALYLPKKDSIKIDFDMYLLRFYMGKNLKGFNNYRAYVYPDSNDFKFSEFSKRDSVMFRYGFAFPKSPGLKEKHPDLIISQPDVKHYKIEWTGKSTIRYFIKGFNYIDGIDSLSRVRPLLIPDRSRPFDKDQSGETQREIFSFLRGNFYN